MKKMLSMILCVALVLTLGVAAFAEEDLVAELGNNTFTHPGDGESIYLTFTAEEAGLYTFTNNTQVSGAWFYVGEDYYTSGYGGVIENVELAAEESVVIELWNNGGAEITYDFDIELTGAAGGGEDDERETNEVPQLGENCMVIPDGTGYGVHEVTFTPDETATYIFTVTEGYLHSSSWGYTQDTQQVTLTADEPFSFNIYSIDGDGGYVCFTIEKQVIEGDTNEEPQIGKNNIPTTGSYYQYAYFTPTESGLYKFTNNHEEGDETSLYDWDFSKSEIFAGESAYVELEAGVEFSFTMYPDDGVATVKFTIEKVDPDTVEPDGSAMFPYVVTDGDTINGEIGSGSYTYWTFTPTADGVLTLTGDLIDASMSVDGMMQIAEDTWVMNVTADEEVELQFYGSYSYSGETNPYVSLDVDFEAGEHQANGSYDNPLTLTEGTLNQFVANDSNYIYFVFTAEDDGILTISGDLQGVTLRLDGSTVDEEGNYVRNVRAGSELEIRLYLSSYSSDVPVELELEVDFEEGVLEPDGTEEFPYELPMGEFNVSLKTYGKIYYTFTAPADGLLLIDSNLPEDITSVSNVYFTGMKNHATPDMFYLNMKEGDVLNLTVSPYTNYDMTAFVSFTEGEEYHSGSSSDPFAIEEGETEIVLTESNSEDGYYYTFTATEAGVYTIVVPENIQFWAHPFTLSDDGRTGTVELEADETITFNLWADKIAVDGVFTFGIDDGNDGPVVDPGDDVPTAGDYTFLVFALMVMSMTAIVVLVSKKRNF